MEKLIETVKQVTETDNVSKDTKVIKDHTKLIRPKKQLVNPSEVCIGAGATLPIPGRAYSSVKVYVQVKVPCEQNQLDKTSELVSKKVQEYLSKELDIALGEDK